MIFKLDKYSKKHLPMQRWFYTFIYFAQILLNFLVATLMFNLALFSKTCSILVLTLSNRNITFFSPSQSSSNIRSTTLLMSKSLKKKTNCVFILILPTLKLRSLFLNFLYNLNKTNQTGQAPLISDPPPTSFTTLLNKNIN